MFDIPKYLYTKNKRCKKKKIHERKLKLDVIMLLWQANSKFTIDCLAAGRVRNTHTHTHTANKHGMSAWKYACACANIWICIVFWYFCIIWHVKHLQQCSARASACKYCIRCWQVVRLFILIAAVVVDVVAVVVAVVAINYVNRQHVLRRVPVHRLPNNYMQWNPLNKIWKLSPLHLHSLSPSHTHTSHCAGIVYGPLLLLTIFMWTFFSLCSYLLHSVLPVYVSVSERRIFSMQICQV